MAKDANYLASVGQSVSDLGSLWSFEVAQASDSLNPVQYLAGDVDAALPAPGLPLNFTRVYGQDLVSRFQTGPFGRGWTDNWDISAEVTEPNGDVIVHGPNGADRFFTNNSNGSFTASPGDYGQLVFDGNTYRLLEADGTLWRFRTDNKLDYVQDTNGNRITLGYTNGLLTSLSHSDGQQLFIEYNAAGQISRLINPLGPGTADDQITTYEYDPTGQELVKVVAPGNRVTAYSYQPLSLDTFKPTGLRGDTNPAILVPDPRSYALLSVAYPDQTHDYFSYDSRGRLIDTERDGNAERVSFSYDQAGEVTVTDATGLKSFLSFGLGGQLVQTRDGAGRIVTLGYNSQSQLDQLRGPGGETSRYSYDARGNLIDVSDALNLDTQFSYSSNLDELTGFTDARGNGIQYGYDSYGDLTSVTYADGTEETYSYDAHGNALTVTNRRGQTLNYTYNSAGQVTSEDDPTTPGVDYRYTYDVAGNLVAATDPTGTTTMTYDPQTDDLLSINYPGGKFFVYEYDSAGRANQADRPGRQH